MGPFDEAAMRQLSGLIDAISPTLHDGSGGLWARGPEPQTRAIKTRSLAAIQRLSPPHTPYRNEAVELQESGKADGWVVPRLMGVLIALRADIEAGYLRQVEELIHADVFADFLEMAEELVAKPYKDPAAVIAGSVLEEHLRKLARRHGVIAETPDGKPVNADRLNAELVKADAYNKFEQKSVTAWLGLRNNAAHGHYDQYDRAQVEALIRDVRQFMVRHPA
jgi:hypothetical protein